jgi:hypothetical protein
MGMKMVISVNPRQLRYKVAVCLLVSSNMFLRSGGNPGGWFHEQRGKARDIERLQTKRKPRYRQSRGTEEETYLNWRFGPHRKVDASSWRM